MKELLIYILGLILIWVGALYNREKAIPSFSKTWWIILSSITLGIYLIKFA